MTGGVLLGVVGLAVTAFGLIASRDPIAIAGLVAVGAGVFLGVFGERIEDEVQIGPATVRLGRRDGRKSELGAVSVVTTALTRQGNLHTELGSRTTAHVMVLLPDGLLDQPQTFEAWRCGKCFRDLTEATIGNLCPHCGADHRVGELLTIERAPLHTLTSLNVYPPAQ